MNVIQFVLYSETILSLPIGNGIGIIEQVFVG